MKLGKIFFSIIFLGTFICAQEVDINFKNLEIEEFVKVVAKITNKNILIDGKINGQVNFVSNKSMQKNQLIELLNSVLETKKYTLVDTGEGFLKVIKKNTALAENLPIVRNSSISQMKTDIIKLNDVDANIVANKFKHLLSSYAKLVILSDSNSIVISDYPKNIKTVKNIINQITNKSKKIVEFIPLQNTKASDLIKDIKLIAKSLFPLKSSLHHVEIMKNDSSNSIIVIGTKHNIEKLYPYIERLDNKQNEDTQKRMSDIESMSAEQSVFVIHLNNAEAGEMATTLNALMKNQQRSKDDIIPFISADKVLNAIVIMSSGIEYQKIKKIVNMLDIERQQVYVKAKIIEISTDRASKMGINLMDDSLNIIGSRNNGIIYSPTVVSLASSINMELKDILKTLTLGATLSFLKQNGVANILSEPSILCMNNEESSIYVGKVQSILTSETQTTASKSGNRTFSREDIGLTLKVKPRLSQDNKVILNVYTKLEDALSNSGSTPTTTKREVKTTAIVADGDSVIVGGLIRNKYTDSVKKIPLLGDIPILGGLFRSTNKTKDMVNLVIILTPYIVNNSGGLSNLKDKLTKLNKLQLLYNKAIGKDLKNSLTKNVVTNIEDELENNTLVTDDITTRQKKILSNKNQDEFMNTIDEPSSNQVQNTNIRKSIKPKKVYKKVYVLGEGSDSDSEEINNLVNEPKPKPKDTINKVVWSENIKYFTKPKKETNQNMNNDTKELSGMIDELQGMVNDLKDTPQTTDPIDIDIEEQLDDKISQFVDMNR